jgi:hypothetical protein
VCLYFHLCPDPKMVRVALGDLRALGLTLAPSCSAIPAPARALTEYGLLQRRLAPL